MIRGYLEDTTRVLWLETVVRFEDENLDLKLTFMKQIQIVFRLNAAPMDEFKEDVGTKFSIGFASVRWADRCWNWDRMQNTTKPKYEGYEVFAQALYANHWGMLPDCQRQYPEYRLHLISYKMVDLADSLVKHYQSVTQHDTKEKKFRSTGLMTVMSAAMVCDHVTLYGFGYSSDKNPRHHYWDPSGGKREWRGHSYSSEKEFYRDLIDKNDKRYKKYFDTYGFPLSARFGDMEL